MSADLPDWALAQRRAVGDRIRQLRVERDIAQDALSVGVGLGKDAVFRAENASNALTLDTLLLIANGLGVAPSVLFDDIPRGPGLG
ncbi:helix-turn-helix domain-containing protein [Streptacidiphilus sp. EB103A]|uniref:helix-turn-helix domain-containing protein n=1 Tax=Streptacidiphilus sp. EB103A TaxID=3156275 RepID=UPI00351102BE